MRWLLIAAVALCAGCSTTFQLRLGKDPSVSQKPADHHCGRYNPPVSEQAPLGPDVMNLPVQDPEVIALLLAAENRELRAYIARRDQRDSQAMLDYRASCTKPGNSSR